MANKLIWWSWVKVVYRLGITLMLKLAPYGSERWQWIREILTYVPGLIGIAGRKHFYNSCLKQGAADLLLLPGAIIDNAHNVEFGENVSIARNVWLNGACSIKIGNNSGIGPQTLIHTANHNYENPDLLFKDQGHTFKPVVLEDDVWLAAGVIVLPGTRIGRGTIVVAGSVVSGNIEPFSVMAGFPARKIGSRGAVTSNG
jgi:maltose O-acetyltransferase